jgi:nicotinate phosphoribosyltransferase
LGIDPKSKEIMYSDGLNFDLVFKLLHSYHDKVNVSFGIGTNLTNDFNEKALSIVMKMTHCNGMPVAKLSDSPGKTMCKDIRYIEYLKYVFNIK